MTRESRRPTDHSDLDDYQTHGTTIFNWYQDLAKYPEVEQHIVRAKVEARKLGFELTNSEVRVPLTEKELDTKVEEIQKRYDLGLDLYAELVAGPRYYSDFTWSEKNRVDYYAEREGIVSPEKVEKISVERIDLALDEG